MTIFFEENNTVFVPGLSRHCAYTQVNEVIILANYSLHPHIHVSLSLQNKIYSSFMRLAVRGARWWLGPYLGIITCLLFIPLPPPFPRVLLKNLGKNSRKCKWLSNIVRRALRYPTRISRIEDIVASPPLVYLHRTLPLFFTLYFFLRRNFT